MIYRVEYNIGLDKREKLPSHAIVDPYKKNKCYALFYKKNELEVPVEAMYVPIEEKKPISKSNYMIKFL